MKVVELFESQRPLIWDLVADLLADGKRVLYHAHIADSSAYLIGMVTQVLDDFLYVKKPGSVFKVPVGMSENDDAYLSLRPSNDPSVADFTIEDAK